MPERETSYWVMATFRDINNTEWEDHVGDIEIPEDAAGNMPVSLEINGVEYKPQF